MPQSREEVISSNSRLGVPSSSRLRDLPVPALPLSNTPTRLDFDIIDARIYYDMSGVVGGAQSTFAPPLGSAITLSGAQQINVAHFTGHVRGVPRRFVCRSVYSHQLLTIDYGEIWLSGVSYPSGAGSPLQGRGGVVKQLSITPGINTPL